MIHLQKEGGALWSVGSDSRAVVVVSVGGKERERYDVAYPLPTKVWVLANSQGWEYFCCAQCTGRQLHGQQFIMYN